MTQQFPESEKFGLTSQRCRAAISIPANIAGGYGKHSATDKVRFYNIAQGSINEGHYYLRLAAGLAYTKTEELFSKIDEVGRMLNGYARKVASA